MGGKENPTWGVMNNTKATVLLVEDDPVDAKLILDVLDNTANSLFRVEWVTSLSDAIARLTRGEVDVVLLDLTLPDAQGIKSFNRVFEAAPNALILALSGADDEDNLHQATQHGALDYFVKDHVDAHWLPRALRYVIEHKFAQDALRISESRFRAMSDVSPLGIFVSDAQGNCTYTNAAYQKISGLGFEQTIGTNWSLAIHPEDRQRVLAEWHDAIPGLKPFESEVRFVREDGSIVWARINAAPIRDAAITVGHVHTVEDITERKATESRLQAVQEALFDEKERAQVTLNSIGDAVLTTSLLGRVTYMNQVAESMTGWPCADALGRPITEVFRIIDFVTRQPVANPVQRAMVENQVVGLAADSVLVRRDGSELGIEDSAAPIHNREGKVTGGVIVFHDVTESRGMASKMAHLAQHDVLTGLPNRTLLVERFNHAIGLAQRNQKQIALLFLDLDYFKNINDRLGHVIGDRLLVSVARRLVECVRATDTVCRQGGDEFVILLTEIEKPQDAAFVSEKLLTMFMKPHLIGKHELHITLSIGISIYPEDGNNVDDIIRNADTAMYHAKASGRNSYQFFREDMNARAVNRAFVENGLRRALKQGEFRLHYQPKVNLATGAITGAEALIRWQDPYRELIFPGQFIAIAEECGLIVPIGRWVLREACRQVQSWIDSGLPAVPVAVNISALEFEHKNFLEGVAEVLKETGLASRYLELELTESILMRDIESSITLLEALKSLGVGVSIDDFGTGYSSLSYLKRFQIDTLKIDQSFVRNIETDADDAIIVTAMIGMVKNLHRYAIAEGIETPGQLAYLQDKQCDEGQGFLLSHPLKTEDFSAFLVNGCGGQIMKSFIPEVAPLEGGLLDGSLN